MITGFIFRVVGGKLIVIHFFIKCIFYDDTCPRMASAAAHNSFSKPMFAFVCFAIIFSCFTIIYILQSSKIYKKFLSI